MKKRKIGLLVICLLVLWWINTLTIKIDHHEITDARIQNDITIVQISDLHGYQFGKNNATLIQKIAAQSPDFIVATGDMYSASDTKGQKIAFTLLSQLTTIAPVYYVNGEHDSDEEFSQDLSQAGVHVLNYQEETIIIHDTPLHLYGTNNLYYSPTFNLHHEWEDHDDTFTILFSHLENFEAFIDFNVDLALCGDTHGGQIRLPFIGALYANGIWFPDLKGHYVSGLYQKNNHYLYVNSGLGSSPIPIRFLERPEIAVITLKPEQ